MVAFSVSSQLQYKILWTFLGLSIQAASFGKHQPIRTDSQVKYSALPLGQEAPLDRAHVPSALREHTIQLEEMIDFWPSEQVIQNLT